MRLLLTNNVSTPSEFLVGNILNDRIGTIETNQKMLLSYLIRPYYKNPRNMKDFQKSGITRETTTGITRIIIPQEKLVLK